MKYAVETASRRVEQQIKRLPKEIYPRVKQAVTSLEDVPRPPGAVKLKDDIYRYVWATIVSFISSTIPAAWW